MTLLVIVVVSHCTEVASDLKQAPDFSFAVIPYALFCLFRDMHGGYGDTVVRSNRDTPSADTLQIVGRPDF
eukprot:scaffold681090_cov62-Prasinocladus_malaysianus.AAC.1